MDFSKKINLLPLFIISLISVIIYSVYVIGINDIKLGVTRNIETNAFTTLLLIFSNASLVIWLYELAYSIINEKRPSVYGILSAVIYNIPGIIISGRDALMIFFVSTIIVFLYSGIYAKKELKKEGKIFKRLIIVFAIALFLVLIYLLFLSSNRYGSEKDALINMFTGTANCEFPEYLKNIYYNCGSFGKLILNVVFYYSSQISKFALIFEQYDGPYMFGLYQLHYVSRLLPDSWNLDFSIVSNKIAEITNNGGAPGLKVFWETAIGYSIYDFGRIGALFITIILGIITGKVNSWCEKDKNIIKILTQVFICVAMFLTVALSPIFDYYYVFPMFWLFFIILIYDKKIIKYKKWRKRND